MLGINGVYNLQNDKIGAVERSEGYKKGSRSPFLERLWSGQTFVQKD